MVKKKVGGGKRYKAALAKDKISAASTGELDASTSGSHADEQPEALPAQHLQRKVNRKVKFLERVAASKQAALQTKAGVKKKRKRKPLADLKALAGTLDELLADQKSSKEPKPKHTFGKSVKRNSVRTVIAAKESARMQQVLKHPEFQANPILAVTKHLQATLPAQQTTGATKGAGRQNQGSHKNRRQISIQLSILTGPRAVQMSRARAIAHQHSLDADDSGDDGQHGEEVDEKLAVRRAKNREAARRVRERRMNQIKTLSEQVAALTLENDRLKGLAARSSQQQAQRSPVLDALGSGAPRPGLSDHSANHTATPTQSQTQQRRSVDRDDHKDHADCGTPSDGSRTSDISGTNEAGVQTDVTMAAQDWSPRDIMQVMTLLTRSSLPDGLAGLQQEASSQQQQQPQPNAQQLQKQLEQLQEQQRQQQQEQQQKEHKQKLQQRQQQQQQQRVQVAQQHSNAMSPSASQGATVSTVPGSHVQDQGQQTAQMPVPNAPFTLEQVQALLDVHSKLLAGQQPSPSNNAAQRASPSPAIPPPALQQPQQQQQHKRGASSVLSPTSGAGAATVAPQPRTQQAHQVQLKQEAPQVPPRQPTWQDLRLLRSTDPASSISMVPWSQASNGPMGPSVVAAAQAAAALAAQGRSGSGGMLGGRSGSGQGDASTSFAPLMQQHQQMYANNTLPADMRQFNRSAGLLFSLDDNDATLMSTDGNLLSDMNLGLTSDMNLASEELLRHVPLPEDAAALGHTAWL